MKIDSSSRIILGTDKEGRKIIVENYEMVPEESDLIEDYIRHAQRAKIALIIIGCVLMVLLTIMEGVNHGERNTKLTRSGTLHRLYCAEGP